MSKFAANNRAFSPELVAKIGIRAMSPCLANYSMPKGCGHAKPALICNIPHAITVHVMAMVRLVFAANLGELETTKKANFWK